MTVLVNRDELQDPWLEEAIRGIDVLRTSVYEVQKRLREVQNNEPVFAWLRGRGFNLEYICPYMDGNKTGYLDILEFRAVKNEISDPTIVDDQLLSDNGSLH